jgi:hypothetical protein
MVRHPYQRLPVTAVMAAREAKAVTGLTAMVVVVVVVVVQAVQQGMEVLFLLSMGACLGLEQLLWQLAR